MRKMTRGAKRPDTTYIGRPKLRLVGAEMTEAERFEHLTGLLAEILSVAQSTQREVEILRAAFEELPDPACKGPSLPAPINRGVMIYGVAAIAGYLGIPKRACQHQVDTKRLPIFHIGRVVCARPSDLDTWLARQSLEGRA